MLRGFSPGKQNADLFRTFLGVFLEHGQDQLRDFLQRVEYALSGDGNRFAGLGQPKDLTVMYEYHSAVAGHLT